MPRQSTRGPRSPRIGGLLLDPEDEWLREYANPHSDGYATYTADGTPLHRLLMGNPKGMDVDHINGNRLDNHKSNLRVVTRSINNVNSARVWSRSGYKGVCLHKFSGLWHASMKKEGKVHSFGYHKTPELANRARLKGEASLFGIQPQRRKFFVDAGLILA